VPLLVERPWTADAGRSASGGGVGEPAARPSCADLGLDYKLVNHFQLESFQGLNPEQPNEPLLGHASDMKVSHDEAIQFLQKYMYFLPVLWMVDGV
jgi:hypothetical protein